MSCVALCLFLPPFSLILSFPFLSFPFLFFSFLSFPSSLYHSSVNNTFHPFLLISSRLVLLTLKGSHDPCLITYTTNHPTNQPINQEQTKNRTDVRVRTHDTGSIPYHRVPSCPFCPVRRMSIRPFLAHPFSFSKTERSRAVMKSEVKLNKGVGGFFTFRFSWG